MAGAAAEGESPSAAEAEWVAWLLNSRLTALRRLGRTDDALAAAQQAARIGALGPDGIEHQLNVSFVLTSLGRMQEAAQMASDIQGLAGYGKAAQALVQFAAARERGDAKAMDAAREVILAQRNDARLFHREMLLDEGNLEGAAAVLIEQLRSPDDRGETLASLQDMRTYPSLPGDVKIDAAWRALKQRADVQAEVARVGRIERYELVSSSTSR
jgi:tetratricopeptide (TPR) repeat protein